MLIFTIYLNFVFTIVFYTTRFIKQDLSYIYFEEFLYKLNLIYFLHIFIFVIDQELWKCNLMSRIMGYDQSLGWNDIYT
jgi:hypothetical protein